MSKTSVRTDAHLANVRELLKDEFYSSCVIDTNEQQNYVGNGSWGNHQNFEITRRNCMEFPTCHVTLLTQKFITLLHSLLDTEGEREEESSLGIAATTKHILMMLQMWIAVIPNEHKKSIQQVPRVAALYRNDALYISYHILLLPFRYSLSDTNSDQTIYSILQLGPFFHSLAESSFKENMNFQKNQIIDILKSGGGLSNTHEEERQESVYFAFQQVEQSLHQLFSSWQEVLPEEVLGENLGAIVESVFSYLIDEVQSMKDFGVEETIALSTLFSDLKKGISQEFPSSKEKAFVPSWNKFKIVGALFNMSMVGIVEMWEKGELQDFTAQEIRKWIKSLFIGSAFRDKNLAKIK